MPKVEDHGSSRHLARREMLGALGALTSLAFFPRCSSDSAGGPTTDAATDAASADASAADGAACHEIPDETAGPYPDLDGMISNAAYQRSNIVEDRAGTPLTLTLTVLAADGCTPVEGAKVIVWHCDKDGIYSEYANSTNAGSATTTYLRGWQVTGADGTVTFTTVYPGWYTPRATHVHVEVYNPSDLTTPKKTTQLGFPDAVNAAVYAQSALYTKGQNSATDDTDQVFGNGTGNGGDDGGGHVYQIATVTGDVTAGYVATLEVALGAY